MIWVLYYIEIKFEDSK